MLGLRPASLRRVLRPRSPAAALAPSRHIYLWPSRELQPKTDTPESLNKVEQKMKQTLLERVQVYTPGFRTQPPPAPLTHFESWAPATYVSPDPSANVLHFSTQYYLSAASAAQPSHASKVVLTVKADSLGLSPPEQRRLAAVAGPRYQHETGTLRLTSKRFPEPFRNKAELRRTLGLLLDDARRHGEAQAQAEAEGGRTLPLAVRSEFASECWRRGTFGARRRGTPRKHLKPQRARTPKP